MEKVFNKKISPSQLIVMLFVTRAFLSTTYGISQNNLNVVLSMLSVLVSTAIQLVMILPPLIFSVKYPQQDFLQVAFLKSKTLGVILSLIYGGYFLYVSWRNIEIFSYFLKNQFLDFLPTPVLIIALGGVAVYGAKLGIQCLARTAFVGVFMFIVTFFVIIFSVTGEIDILNIQIATPVSKNTTAAFFSDVFNKIGRSDELVALPFLLCYTKNRKKRATFSYMGIKLAVMEVMIFYSVMVLGEYTSTLSQPFYTLSTYAKTSVIERFDSIYMSVWTLGSVIKSGILIYLGAKCFENVSVKRPFLVSGGVPIAVAVVFSALNKYDSVIFTSPSAFVVLILSSLIPLGLCFDFKKKRRNLP